jgi:hypothetical protein
MNTKNFEFLRDGLKFMGFGETMNAELENKIKKQPAEFQLNFTGDFKKPDGADKVEYRLDFKKSDKTDMYFFNRYHATLKNDDPAKDRTQTFYINKNTGVTAKEAYNLLSGRSVNKDLLKKDGEPFNAWLQIDFTDKDKNNNFTMKQFIDRYGYDLPKTLDAQPIKELGDAQQRERILKSLEKGNTVQVTFSRDGKELPRHIEANPQFKSLNVYDEKMQKVFQENGKKEVKSAPEKSKESEKKETQKQELEEGDGKKEKRPRRKGIGV